MGYLAGFFLQPECQPRPTAGVALQSERTFAVPFKVLWNPSVPTTATDLTGVAVEFFGFELRAQGACFDGFAGIVCPQTGGFVASDAVGVNELDEPEWRMLLFVKRCHT